MAKVFNGDAAERALIDKSGITSAQLHDKVVALGEAAQEIADNDVSVMLNLYTHGLCSIITTLEQTGEVNILNTVLSTLKSGVGNIRDHNKKASN